MPIVDVPFRRLGDIMGTPLPDDPPRPWLNIRIINPASNISHMFCGLVDTGADGIAIPSPFANILGHNLTAGKLRITDTAGGRTKAYEHTTIIEFVDDNGRVLYATPEIIVKYTVNLPIVLLGVQGFLINFILTVDYLNQTFSIRNQP